MNNKDIVEALSGVFYLATVEDDQPHVRPFDKAAEIDGKLYIGTSRTKKVFFQIVENPKLEIFAMSEFGTTRFMAEGYEEEDEEVAKKAFEEMGKPFNDDSVAIRLEKVR